MKNIFKRTKSIVAVLLMGSAITSCDSFFEEPIAENISQYVVFDNMYNAERALYDCYYMIPYEWPYYINNTTTEKRSGIHVDITASICDEARGAATWGGARYAFYGDGVLDPSSWKYNYVEYIYREPYYYMRDCYTFLENMSLVSDATESWKTEKTAEAKFLIALGYTELLRRYGSVPWVDQVYYDASAMDLTRMPLAEIVEKVDDLIEEAIPDLRTRIEQSDNDYGMATKGMAYFLRARLWLYMASPLWNRDLPYGFESYEYPEIVCLQYSDPLEAWNRAKEYTLEAITFLEANGYSLMQATGTTSEDYQAAYTWATRDLVGNTEIVSFSRRTATYTSSNNNNINGRHRPPGNGYQSGPVGFTAASQNLVSKYYVKVSDTEYREQTAEDYMNPQPWENMTLDPRFYSSIIYDGLDYGSPTTEEIHTQNLDQYVSSTSHGFVTGYYMRKHLHPEMFTDIYLSKDLPYYYMRLGELYLNYAEILNEVGASSSEIETYLNKTVNRVGMPSLSLSGKSQEEIRTVIRRERAVELAFENHRYHDVKRWLIAEEDGIGNTVNAIVRYGDYGDPDTYYKEEPCPDALQTNWYNKLYYFPFENADILLGRGQVQNPGW